MNEIEKQKEDIIQKIRKLQKEIRTLAERVGHAESRLIYVKTKEDLEEWKSENDLERGLEMIQIFG